MMMNFSINTILSDENILQAIEFLKTKKNACGDDGIWLHDLEDYWNRNKSVLRATIKNEIYNPQMVHEKVILMPNGKHRKIALLSSIDRMLLRAILQVIQVPVEQEFSKYSFAYQQGKGVDSAVMSSAAYIQMGKEYVIEIDIKDFFDSIDHEYLLSKIKCLLADSALYNLLVKYIACRVETDCLIQTKTSGLLQGSSLSPLLSNLYLTELDNWMKMQGYMFARFADNINIYVLNLQEGYQILGEVISWLRIHRLEINKEKTGIFSVYSRKYLGYVFEKSGENILVKRYNSQKKKIFSNWRKNSVEHVGNDYYIVNNGILTKKDFTILFANEEQKVYIPAETSDTINIYSNIVIGLNFLETLHDKQLNLNIFNKYGTYIGSFYSVNQRNRMKCLMEQVDTYRDTRKRLSYA